jgi:hypothetical protein
MKSLVRSTVTILMLMLSACASMHGLKASAALRAPDSLASSQSLSQAPARLPAGPPAIYESLWSERLTFGIAMPARAVRSEGTSTVGRLVGPESPFPSMASRVKVRADVFGEEIQQCLYFWSEPA